ncbi:aspartate ammonia-lyase [Oceanobacter sp. 4_MG-2023]|uniref:aspartate ammonia-lyase n=1 Tax=Oceanobacter sp. 4_MG-2023 TaxID=3062623 RepID=UPI00273243F4|nr:aspartate ammonia-lyase [Oceanobacter sp. 4_MG-2023]MDP2547213.1 aspartate ammonia-lyase [Oceanobacter sp. 4_MG-2023]
MTDAVEYRLEKDLLGEREVPASAYFGIQSQRAKDNFDLSGVTLAHFPKLINALAMVKQACALANTELGLLDQQRCNAIVAAGDRLLQGQFHQQFVVDMIQGGAGTSTNMNANEVIANIGLELMGHARGDYQYLHPNNDVNRAQSTNDVYPTAARLGILLSHGDLVESLVSLQASLRDKSHEFADVIKMGRTQLQDAVPMTLGQEFGAWASTLGEDVRVIAALSELLKEVNLGGTAIGTGINADPRYGKLAIKHLSSISGFALTQSEDLIEASSDMGAFVLFSSMLKRLAIKLSKISNDLRLLSMGPRAGINEINLPPQQPGSSIMPGKVNPVIPEAVNQVAYQVMGHDLAICMAAEAGQLQLNAMEPLIVYNLLESMRLIKRAMVMLEKRCINGITANHQECADMVHHSIGLVTALNPYIGYENATRIARRALQENRTVIDLVEEEQLLPAAELRRILEPKRLIHAVQDVAVQ